MTGAKKVSHLVNTFITKHLYFKQIHLIRESNNNMILQQSQN